MTKQNELFPFEQYLKKQNLSENTIRSYLFAVESYKKMFKKVNSQKIAEYRDFLIKNYKPQTVNLRLIGFTKYLKFIKKDKLRPKLVKEQRKTFLQNVITNEEYERLKESLKNDNKQKWIFVVRFLASTGVRVSELVQIRTEHVRQGFADIRAKGGKTRRVYFPKKLQADTLSWLSHLDRPDGFLFLNETGFQISVRGISSQLKHFARTYNIEETVVHPHSFRHLFAKNFLERHSDITFLADLLGHESIDTTRIYLRKSTEEQHSIVNSVVNW